MKDLIQMILDHPQRFEPTDFAHCGLQSLVRIAQEAHPYSLEASVQAHHQRVEHLVHA